MSSLARRIQLRLEAKIINPEAHREARAKLLADPKFGKPLLKHGRACGRFRRKRWKKYGQHRCRKAAA